MVFVRSLAIALVAAAPAAAESLAGWLPDDVLYYAGTADLGRLRERAAKGPLGAIWADPALRPLRAALGARLAPRRGEDVTALDLLELVRGEASVAGVRGATLSFVDCGERARLFEALLLRYHAQQARDLAIVETRERFLGHGIRVRRLAGSREVHAHVRVGSAFCFSDDVAVLREALARREAGGAGGPDVGDARGADAFAWVSPTHWIGGSEEAALLGFDRVSSIVARADVEADGVSADVLLRVAGEPTGIVRLLMRGAPGVGPPSLLPAGTLASCTVALDWEDVLGELLRIRPDLGPALGAEARALRGVLGIDLRRDVLGALGDELTLALVPPSWSDLGSDSVPDPATPLGDPVILLELRRPEAIEGLLRRIGAPEHDGVWILPGERFPFVAVTDGHLALATRLGALRRLRGPLPGVRDGAACAAAMARMPAERTVFAFADPQALPGPLPRGLPPVPAALLNHTTFSAFAIGRDGDGLRFRWFVRLR
jgi:hypothetical protein